MDPILINTAKDLAAILGTPAHDAFMEKLAGSLWRLDRDDVAGSWVAVADESTVNRFGLSAADFPNATPPTLPVYVAFVEPVPESISMAQAQLALLAAGHLDAVEAAITTMPREAQIVWNKAAKVVRGDPLVVQLASLLKLTAKDVDALFLAGVKL
jgi:hypothetical protein